MMEPNSRFNQVLVSIATLVVIAVSALIAAALIGLLVRAVLVVWTNLP